MRVILGGAIVFGLILAAATCEEARVPTSTCQRELGPFLAALGEIDSRLDVGLSVREYGTLVGDAKVGYDRVAIARLPPACIEEVAQPAEEALNEYVEAFTFWEKCIRTNCTDGFLRDGLNRHWEEARALLERARS